MKNLILLLISTSIFITLQSKAALINTAGDGNWANTSTWTGGVLPGVTDDVQIDNNDSIWVILTDSYTIAELFMGNNSIINIEGNLTLDSLHINNNAILYVSGTLTIIGGISISNNAGLTINQTGSMDVQGDIVANNGTSLTVNGDLNVDGDVTFEGSGEITVGDAGTIDITGSLDTGTATVDGTGPITVDGTIEGTNSGDSQINGALPVELIEFKAEYELEKVHVNWITVSEENNDFFTIERSADGINFEILDFIDGAGNANRLLKYEYTDRSPLDGIAYYRLKQTDFDGKFEYSNIVTVNNETVSDYQTNIYPNPVQSNSQFTIKVSGFSPEAEMTIEIKNSIGNMVDSYIIYSIGSGSVNIIVETQNILPGIYFINFITNGEIKATKLIVK